MAFPNGARIFNFSQLRHVGALQVPEKEQFLRKNEEKSASGLQWLHTSKSTRRKLSSCFHEVQEVCETKMDFFLFKINRLLKESANTKCFENKKVRKIPFLHGCFVTYQNTSNNLQPLHKTWQNLEIICGCQKNFIWVTAWFYQSQRVLDFWVGI